MGFCKTKDHESARFMMQEMYELWKISKPLEKYISGDFSLEEFASSLQVLKSGKASSPDSIFPELILHTDAALVKQVPVLLHAPAQAS